MIDRVAFEIFSIKIYWYGIVYAIGFLFSYFFAYKFIKENTKITKEEYETMFLYTMITSVIGGRIFEIIIYQLPYYLANPTKVIAFWEGGMSIQGGMLFGFLTVYYFSKKYKFNFYKVTDIFSIPLLLFLSFGRLANFINQELVGTVTTSKLGVIFPLYDNQTRWPTQIFESVKNMLAFQITYFLYTYKKLKPGYITIITILIYNLGRFLIDFLREHTLSLGIISMGQLLCIIYSTFAIYLYFKIKNNK